MKVQQFTVVCSGHRFSFGLHRSCMDEYKFADSVMLFLLYTTDHRMMMMMMICSYSCTIRCCPTVTWMSHRFYRFQHRIEVDKLSSCVSASINEASQWMWKTNYSCSMPSWKYCGILLRVNTLLTYIHWWDWFRHWQCSIAANLNMDSTHACYNSQCVFHCIVPDSQQHVVFFISSRLVITSPYTCH